MPRRFNPITMRGPQSQAQIKITHYTTAGLWLAPTDADAASDVNRTIRNARLMSALLILIAFILSVEPFILSFRELIKNSSSRALSVACLCFCVRRSLSFSHVIAVDAPSEKKNRIVAGEMES